MPAAETSGPAADIESQAEMPFILSTGGQKGDPATRKFIRSHVMLGKNKGKSRPAKRRKPPLWEIVPTRNSTCGTNGVQDPSSAIPMKVGSDWSFTQLADEIEPVALADILKCELTSNVNWILDVQDAHRLSSVSSVAKQATVALEACFSFHKNDGGLVEPLAFDAAYLHAAALGTGIYIGLMLDSGTRLALHRTSPHFSKALRLLRERLSLGDEVEKISDSTIAVVIALALHARITGDYGAAKHHMEGILEIAELRGGVVGISHRTMLAMEIFRCDIGLAIETGSKPVFFGAALRREPFMPFSEQISFSKATMTDETGSQRGSEQSLGIIDDDLATVWDAMKRFCSLINRTVKLRRRLPEETLLQAMASIMYRLLHMRFAPTSFDEVFWLALMAFSSQAFLQLPNVKIQETPLSAIYRERLVNFEALGREAPRVLLWLQMVGSVSLFGASDHVWLKPLLQSSVERCRVRSWSEAADVMNSFIWIRLVFDKPGKNIFDTLTLS